MLVSNVKKLSRKAVLLFILFVAAFSYKAKAGGDVYEIYLNNKLVLKQFVIEPVHIKNLIFSNAKPTDKLRVKYRHCGVVGKARSIAIRDEKGTVLKEWKFSDAANSGEDMQIPVEEMLAVQRKNNLKQLSLYYTAKEMPRGRTLIVLNRGVKNSDT
jgi:hypothetical protein